MSAPSGPAPAGPGTHLHGRVKALFNAVCDLPDAAAQRAALCRHGADEALAAEVMALLGHADHTTHFSAPVAAAALQWLGSEFKSGDRRGARAAL